MRRLFFFVASGSLLVSPLAGQAADPGRCAAAAAAVRNARLSSPEDTTPNGFYWYRLAQCGAAGIAAAANAIRSPSFLSEQDPARVQQFFTLFYATRDPALFSSLTNAVRGSSTSPVVQREAIRALGAMYTPIYDFSPSDFLTRPFPRFCGHVMSGASFAGDASVLPSDYVMQIREAMEAVERREDNAPDVRGAAHCWRITLEGESVPDPRKVSLKHVCDQSFIAINENVAAVHVSVEVEGTTDWSGHMGFTIGANSDAPFTILVSGNAQHFVRLLVNGVQVGRKETSKEKCKRTHREEGDASSVIRKVPLQAR